MDKWLISKLNKLIKDVTDSYEAYDLNPITRKITDFLNDDLSNWYIRGNRRRFWESELTESKKAVYLTTYEVLVTLAKLVAPITPYISEEIYKNLTDEESVHLADFPKYDESLIDLDVEKQMDLVRDICSLGRDARENVKIKVRQPISEVVLPYKDKDIIGDLVSIIKEELNVKNILFIEDMTKYMNYIAKPNFKEVGRILGSKINKFKDELSKLSNEDIEKIKNDKLIMNLDGENIEVNNTMVEVSIDVKEGFCSSNNGNTFVILNTELTQDLILEGYARELVRKIQSLRKEADLVITDRIKVWYNGNDMIDMTMTKFEDFIKNETLALELIKQENISEKYNINDIDCELKIERI